MISASGIVYQHARVVSVLGGRSRSTISMVSFVDVVRRW